MDKKLDGILEILNKLNSKTNIVTKKEIDEQYDNLEDYRKLTLDLDLLLNNFENENINDVDKAEEMLFETHRIITTFEW